MNFEEELNQIIQSQDGVLHAMIMAFDGIPVATCNREGSDSKDSDTVVESTNLLRQYMKLFQDDRQANIQEFLIRTNRNQFLFKPISDEYFLCVIMTPEALFGKVRYALDRRTKAIAAAF